MMHKRTPIAFTFCFMFSLGLVLHYVVPAWAADQIGDVRWGQATHTSFVYKPMKYESLMDWELKSHWLRDQIRFAAGLIPEPQRAPINAKIFGQLRRDGYTVEKVYFESRPGLYVTGNLYRPTAKIKGKIPAVACPHGHWKRGRLHHDDRGSIPARCITLARMGAIVFAYDMVGWNDSSYQFNHRQINSPQRDLWGINSFGLQTFNSMRVIDFLSNLPKVDPKRIAITGASGGGTQTYAISAIDDRVSVACPVNMVSGIFQGGCSCENAPGLRIDTNNMELAALTAPRPMLLISCAGDWTRNTPHLEFPAIRDIYNFYYADNRIAYVRVNAMHNYNRSSRQAMYRWFNKWLFKRSDDQMVTEIEYQPEADQNLLAFTDENIPESLLNLEQLTERMKDDSRKQIEAIKPENKDQLSQLSRLVNTSLSHAVASEFPAEEDVRVAYVGTQPSGNQQWVRDDRFYERGNRIVYARSFVPRKADQVSGELTIFIHPAGRDAAKELMPVVEQLIPSGHQILFVEPFDTGYSKLPEAVRQLRRSGNFYTTFNRTDVAERVYDILTVLAVHLNDKSIERVNLVGMGKLGPVTLLSRSFILPQVFKEKTVRTVVDMNQFDVDNDEAYLKDLYLPGIQRMGGLRAIAAVAANADIRFHNVDDVTDLFWGQMAAEILNAKCRIDRQKMDLNTLIGWLTGKNIQTLPHTE